jgi:hypothetical protein
MQMIWKLPRPSNKVPTMKADEHRILSPRKRLGDQDRDFEGRWCLSHDFVGVVMDIKGDKSWVLGQHVSRSVSG